MEMNTGERVAEAFWYSVGVMALICFVFWFFMPIGLGQPSRYTLFVRWFRHRYFPITSSDEDMIEIEVPVVPPVVSVVTTGATALPVVAKPSNEGNSQLPDNEAVVFQLKIELLAALIKGGQITNMARGIEVAFKCSRSSKENSTYEQARRALAPLIAPPGPRWPRPLTPEEAEMREDAGLPVQ